jgi:hypothetical protein
METLVRRVKIFVLDGAVFICRALLYREASCISVQVYNLGIVKGFLRRFAITEVFEVCEHAWMIVSKGEPRAEKKCLRTRRRVDTWPK